MRSVTAMRFRRSILALAVCAATLVAPAQADPVRERIYRPVALDDTEARFEGERPQDVSVTTGDGLELRGYFFPGEPGNDQIVVYFHGRDYNQLVAAVDAEPLRAGGRAVLVASYRGYGGNPGEPAQDGLMLDGEAWVAKARELAPDHRLYLFGFSLGGAVALEMASRHDVTALATMGAFARLADQAPWIVRGMLPDKYDNVAAVARVSEPYVLLHGTEDDVVKPKAADILEAAGGDNLVRVNLTGGGHRVPLAQIAPRLWELWESLECGEVPQ